VFAKIAFEIAVRRASKKVKSLADLQKPRLRGPCCGADQVPCGSTRRVSGERAAVSNLPRGSKEEQRHGDAEKKSSIGEADRQHRVTSSDVQASKGNKRSGVKIAGPGQRDRDLP